MGKVLTISPSMLLVLMNPQSPYTVSIKILIAYMWTCIKVLISNSRYWVNKSLGIFVVIVVQSLSHVWIFVIPGAIACQASLPALSLGVCSVHAHWVHDAIKTFHPLPTPFHFAFSLSQHKDLFQRVESASGSQNIGASASVLSMNIQD